MSSDYTSRSRLFRDALTDALSTNSQPSGDDRSLSLLSLLLTRCRAHAGDDATAGVALDAFEAMVQRGSEDEALSEAASLFESPQRFRDALFFLRCLDRDPERALALMRQRAYLSAALAPAATHPELANEQAALLDASTFEMLWKATAGLPAEEESIAQWRRAYAPEYTTAHGDYNAHLARIMEDIEAAQWQTEVLEKLNRLERLGEAVATAALVRFHALEAQAVCQADAVELATELMESPVCPFCGYRLGDVAPVEGLNESLVAIERGLATQATRLKQRVVAPLLARPGRVREERLERFIEVVQTGDLPGLARTLDEGMLEFLSDLLQTPEPRVNLINRLAKAYPEVTTDSVDEVVEAFRALLRDELDNGGGRVVIGREEVE